MKMTKRRITQKLTPQKTLKLGKRLKILIIQNLTYEKPSKLTKRENLKLQK